MPSIVDKLLCLDPRTKVLPGHGPSTTIAWVEYLCAFATLGVALYSLFLSVPLKVSQYSLHVHWSHTPPRTVLALLTHTAPRNAVHRM